MEESYKAQCDWKCNVTTSETPKWHTGTVCLIHSDDSCWRMHFYVAVKHGNGMPRYSIRLNMMTKLLVQKERIIVFIQNTTYSCKFKTDLEKEKISPLLTEIENRPCPLHSGLLFSNTSRFHGGLRNIEAMANSQHSSNFMMSQYTPAKEDVVVSTQSTSHIKTSANNFTRVKEHSLSPLDEIVDNSYPFERTYSSTGKGSENKKGFLESSALKSEKIISLPDFYGSRSSSNGLTGSSGNLGYKRKPGFLSLNEGGEGRKLKLANTALMSTRKQHTLDDMNFKRGAQLQGFSNLGNTCYMNSILQSLFCLLPFVSDLVAASQKLSSSPRDKLCLALVHLLHAPDAVAERERLLAKVKDTVSKSARRFSGHEQHDAHEFLSQVLDQLKDEATIPLKTDPSALDAHDSDPTVCNPTIQNFESEIQQMITCTKCKQEYCSKCITNDISLDVPQGIRRISLHDCIQHYFKPHSVEYNCANCGNNSGLVTYHFLRLPRIFILLLKRYKFNSVTTNHRKIVENIVIPQYISLSEQCGTDTKPPNKLSLYQANSLQQPKHLFQRLKERFTFKKKMPSSFKDKSQNDGKTDETQDGQSKNVNADLKYYDEEELKDMSDEEKLAIALNLSCNGLENGTKIDVNSASANSDVVDTLELTCETVETETSKEITENAVPELSETPLGPRHDASWTKSLTPDKSGTSSVNSLKRRVSKELFPVKDCQTPEEPAQPLVETSSEIAKDFGSPKHSTEASIEGGSERKRARLSDPFDASTIDEDKENVLPSFCDANPKPLAGFGEDLTAGVQQTDEQFDADMKLAIALSLQNQEEEQERIKQLNSDDDNCEDYEDPLLLESVGIRDPEEQIKAAQTGLLPHSYHLMSIVSHIGSSSSIGHYVTDLYDFSSKEWYSCDDSTISPTSEENVRTKRQGSGYIFFYLSKELEEEVKNIKQS